MRRVFLSATFLLLLAGLLLLWRYRFERVPDSPSLGLAELRAAMPELPPGAQWMGSMEHPALRLTVGPEHRSVAVRMELPGLPAMEALQIRFSMAAKNLTRGKHEWDDGRALIEWRSADGVGQQETDPVGSLRENKSSGETTLVVRPSSGSSIPVLRVEHLGEGGDFEITQLEMIPVKERSLWIYGRWGLLAGWFVWFVMLLAGGDQRSIWRRIAAAGIWLGMAIYFVVPGPWKTLRPLGIPFVIGPPVSWVTPANQPARNGQASQAASSITPPPPGSEVLGRIPLQGGWIIHVKYHLARLRPLLHALLLFAPALALAWLLGRKPAIALALGLAVSIEAAQTAFGYGFDWLDVLDLASDAIGIALAIWVYRIARHQGCWKVARPR